MSDRTRAEARRRFGDVAASLAAAADPGAIRAGFADLGPGEDVTELLARADTELLDGRRREHPSTRLVAAPQTAAPRDGDGHRPGNAMSLTISGVAQAPSRSRAALAALGGDIDPRQLAQLQLLISELVTNSVIHGDAGPRGQITIQVTVREHTVHGEVSDSGPGFRADARTPRRENGGLGLVIIERSANRWGTTHGGRRVWFELDRHHEGRPALAEPASLTSPRASPAVASSRLHRSGPGARP
jgi:anti-sigma regulatory factor (Ser/Thr protein kinase)